MGREVRRVPANWEHPKDENGHHLPIHDEDFETAVTRWKDDFAAWERRDSSALSGCDSENFDKYEYWEWNGNPPDREYYRPKWTDDERTHFQLYQTVSEGTPLSPPMPTIEALARWLADNKVSVFADETLSYREWLRFCQAGSAPSMIFTPQTGLISGVKAIGLQGDNA